MVVIKESRDLIGITPSTYSSPILSLDGNLESLAPSRNQLLHSFSRNLSGRSYRYLDNEINVDSLGMAKDSCSLIGTIKPSHSPLVQPLDSLSGPLLTAPLDTSSRNELLPSFPRKSSSSTFSSPLLNRSYCFSDNEINDNSVRIAKDSFSIIATTKPSNLFPEQSSDGLSGPLSAAPLATSSQHELSSSTFSSPLLNSSHISVKKSQKNGTYLSLNDPKKTPRSERKYKSCLLLPSVKEEYDSTFKIGKDIWSDKISRFIHKATANDFKIRNKLISVSGQDTCTTNSSKMNSAITRCQNNTFSHSSRISNCSKLQIDASSASAFAIPLPPPHFKIYVLVMEPTSRIFEIISMVYDPKISTIANLLHLIPKNCTEYSLGHLTYEGFCRPRKSSSATQILTDFSMKASGTHRDGTCARILCGEIIVAIPHGYTGKECQEISKVIFKSPKIVKLLSKSEPLKMRSREGKSSRRHGDILGIASMKCNSPCSVIPPLIEDVNNL